MQMQDSPPSIPIIIYRGAGLFPSRQRTPFAAVEAAVGVIFDFHVGFDQLLAGFADELEVFDVQAPVEPLLFVVGADGEDFVGRAAVVEVVGRDAHRVAVGLHHLAGVGEKELAVGLEVDEALAGEDFAVQLHEAGRGEPLVYLLHLRVGEGNPNLRHLARGEELRDQLDAGAEESDVRHPALQRLLGTTPHPRPLDIHADEVLPGEEAAEADGIFPLATAQLEHNRVVILEKQLVPPAAHREALLLQHGIRILEHMRVARHIAKLC